MVKRGPASALDGPALERGNVGNGTAWGNGKGKVG